jgi:hypothetical protein
MDHRKTFCSKLLTLPDCPIKPLGYSCFPSSWRLPAVTADALAPDVLNIAQTTQGWLTQYPPMSLASWYYHKADQCARLAKDAIEPRKRSDFETERKLWLQIAEQIEMDEVRWFRPEPM